jgi:hypothetical protein
VERLNASGGFGAHDYRHGFKLLKQADGEMHLANRKGHGCPACSREFDRLLVSETRHNTFGAPPGPFCLTRTDERVLLLTH